MTPRWALFLSGRGSTAQSLLDLAGEIDIRLVVSSRAEAPGVGRARRLGIPVLILSKKVDWESLTTELSNRRIDFIFLLGFMKLLPADFLKTWAGRVWNVHPSLLPTYPGLQAMEKSFQDKAPMGVTVHEVIPEMDAGAVCLQKVVRADSDFESTKLKMARVEQRLIREWALHLRARRAV